MTRVLESGFASVNKVGEELCGDNVAITYKNGVSTLVLADGLGSGVKANILSILTSKILCTMLSEEIDIEDAIETIIQSLPVCKLRNVAYSTFSIIHVDQNGEGYLVEFDNPEAMLFRDGKCLDLDREMMLICQKKIFKSKLQLQLDDVVIVMSDGVMHAGIGMLLNFGWQRKEIKEYLERTIKKNMSARAVATMLASACNDLYLDRPGDDTTVACIKIKEKLTVNIMVGPPVDKEQDSFYVERFLAQDGKKVVCGGTSSQIVARYLNKPINTTLDFVDKEVPPIAHIDGIDLTTEGVITIRKMLEITENYINPSNMSPKYFVKKDGASLLADILLEQATDINFFVGQGVNIAHQGLPIDSTMKFKLVEKLQKNLSALGKNVTVNYD